MSTQSSQENKNTAFATYIVGRDRLVEKMFKRHSDLFSLVSNPKLARVFVFTGGPDIDPGFYNEHPIEECGPPDKDRDCFEEKVYIEVEEPPFIKIGICRGAQFLNVMNGGSLWQHVDNHTTSHPIIIQKTKSFDNKGLVSYKAVTSTHHQMMRPNLSGGAELIAYTNRAIVRKAAGSQHIGNIFNDAEVVFYPDTNSLCFQPHPEYDTNTEECFRAIYTQLTFKDKAA
jgi:gamma-glutamyl-gamma-aminobutyrate hydrolase PuuD